MLQYMWRLSVFFSPLSVLYLVVFVRFLTFATETNDKIKINKPNKTAKQ